jgi:hypothetical protein
MFLHSVFLRPSASRPVDNAKLFQCVPFIPGLDQTHFLHFITIVFATDVIDWDLLIVTELASQFHDLGFQKKSCNHNV